MATEAPADPEAQAALEARRQAQCAQRWIAELGVSEKFQRKWLERAKKITRRYRRDDRAPTDPVRQFAMLWSNTQTIQPAIYSRPPQPVVVRRHTDDPNPVVRIAGEILERCLTTSIDLEDLDGRLRQCSFDFVLLARAQTWERYVPTHGPEVVPEIELQVTTNGDSEESATYTDAEGNEYDRDEQVKFRQDGSPYALGEPYRPVIYEQSVTDYVNWEDFGHSPARTWDEVSYVWRRVYLSREQLIERFGENLGKLIPLDWGPIEQGRSDDSARLQKKAAIYEIWDKGSKRVFWISKSWNSRPLDERDDPLGLDGFFPCPRPMIGTTANDSVIPVPDYVFYQDQAEEVDKLTARIAELQDAVKVRGFYAADAKSNINTLLNASNTMLIPVPDWLSFKEGGGASGKVEWWPINLVVQALQALIEQRQQLINDIYQITGVADILRGMGDPRATATAEQLKGQWGTLRVRDRQIEVMRFARDVLRIKGEVMAGKFSADTLKAMSGFQLPTAEEKAQAQATYEMAAQQYQLAVQAAQQSGQQPPPQPEVPPELQRILSSPTWEDVEAFLQDDAARAFKIDIETDSTIEPNEQQEKAQYVEFVGALGQMMSTWGPAVEARPELAELAGAVIKAGVRKFRAGREIEDVLDRTMDAISKQAAQPQQAQAPQPDPTKLAVEQIKAGVAQMQEQGENQRAQAENQLKAGELALREQETTAQIIALNRDPRPQATI